MSDETRNVQVKLVLDIDKSAPRMFQSFARELNKSNKAVSTEMDKQARKTASDFADYQTKLYKRSGTAAQLGFGGFGQSVAGNTNFASGLNNLGFSGAAGLAQRAAIPLAIAAQSAKLAEFAANAHYDVYSTQAQKGRSFVREFVPGGEKIQNFVDAVSGRRAGYEQADIEAQQANARGNFRNQLDAFQAGFRPRQASAEALAKSFAGQRAVTPSVFNRGDVLGERAFREEQRVLPLRQAAAKAERDVAQATSERLANERELSGLSKTGIDLTKQRGVLEKALNKDENASGVSRERILKQIESVNQELTGNLHNQRSAREGILSSGQREVGAQGELTRANLRADLEGRASVLESRGQQGLSTAGALGSLNPYERQFAVEALKNAEQYGWDAIPPEAQSAVSRIAPERAEKLRQKAGLSSSAYGALGAAGFSDIAPSDPQAMITQADRLRQQLSQGEFDADKNQAQKFAELGRGFGRDVANIMIQLLEGALSEIQNRVLRGRNAS